MKEPHPLEDYLKPVRWRLRLRDGLLLAQRTLWLAGLASIAYLALVRLFPIEQRAWAWAPLAVWLIGLAGYSLFRPLPAIRVAQITDFELQLKERISSSLALEKDQNNPRFNAFDPGLVAHARQDALEHAQAIQPARDFPILLDRKPLVIAAVVLLICLVLVVLPNPMDAVIAERKAVAEETRRQAEEIEKLREEIAESENLSQEERDELLRRLDELARQLRANQGNREEALANLSKLETELRQRADPKNAQRQAALDAMAAQLQALAKKENPQIGDLEAAAEALEKLAEQLQGMSQEEREALAEQLNQMAVRAAQSGDGALAQALASMAQAAQSGDLQSAQESASQAAEVMRRARSELADQQAINQALAQLQNSRQQISRAGQGSQRAQGQQGAPGQSPGSNPGQGQQGQGQGQSQSQGQASGGGGTNSNTLPPSTRTGSAADPQGQGRDTGADRADSQVYIPREKLQGLDGEDVFVPGQDTGQGETQTSEQPDPLGGLNNPSLVPYSQVYQAYQDAANQALEQSYIPLELKDLVREYFSQLEP